MEEEPPCKKISLDYDIPNVCKIIDRQEFTIAAELKIAKGEIKWDMRTLLIMRNLYFKNESTQRALERQQLLRRELMITLDELRTENNRQSAILLLAADRQMYADLKIQVLTLKNHLLEQRLQDQQTEEY